MKQTKSIILLATLLISACVVNAADYIGDWRWGADGNSPHNDEAWGNYAQDAYHAAPQNSAVAANGTAEVRYVGGNATDKFFNCGPINELDNAQQVTWTFEDVVFKTGGSTFYTLCGGVHPAAFADLRHKFYISWNGAASFEVSLWKAGDTTRYQTFFTWSPTKDSQTNDIQIVFDGTKGITGNVGLRYRDATQTAWKTTELEWGNNTVTQINDNAKDVCIGKQREGSSTCGNIDMGRVTISTNLPAELRLRPDHDNEVEEINPDVIQDHEGNMYLSGPARSTYRHIYMRFDATNMLSYGSISSATLVIRTITQTADTNKTVSVHEVADDSWLETTITWNNKPAIGSLIDSFIAPHVKYISQVNYIDVTSYIADSHKAGDGQISFRISSDDAMTFIRADEHPTQTDHPWAELIIEAGPVILPTGTIIIIK